MSAGNKLRSCGIAKIIEAISDFIESDNMEDEEDFFSNECNNMEEVLECLHGIVTDLKDIHKRQDEQSDSLKRLEEKIENVNGHLDCIVDGK